MKAILEFELPEERRQFKTAARAESWRLLLHGLMQDLTALCQVEHAGQPTTRQILWLLNYTEMKMREVNIDSEDAPSPNEPDGTSPPAGLAGIASAVLTFQQTERWINETNQDYGASPLRVICACGSSGAKLIARDLEKMEAQLEAIQTKQPVSTGQAAHSSLR